MLDRVLTVTIHSGPHVGAYSDSRQNPTSREVGEWQSRKEPQDDFGTPATHPIQDLSTRKEPTIPCS